MFNLKYLGHSGWLIKNNNFKILCDPWFNPEGAFFSAWFPFPDNLHILNQDLFTDLDFVYVSHSHQDHFDPWFLKNLDPKTRFIIPKFSDRLLLNKLKKLGFKNITQLAEDQEIDVNGVKVKIIIHDQMIEKDSGILLDDGKHKILNLNDCHPEFNEVKDFANNLDLLLLQSSSAIWWPCVYEYSESDMKAMGRLKRKNVMTRSVKYAQQLKPRFVVPNAGPPAFLSEHARIWDETRREDHNPFVLQDEVQKFFSDNKVPSLFVIPGSTITVGEQIILNCDIEKRDHIYNNVVEYMNEYRDRRKSSFMNLVATDDELNNLVEKFSNLVKDVVKNSLVFKNKVKFPILIELGHLGKWLINFSKSVDDCFIRYDNHDYNYHFKFDPHIISILFREEHIDLEDYLLSMRFKCNRKVDEFNEFLFSIFKSFDVKRLRIAEINYMNKKKEINTDETFVLNDLYGKEKEVKRFCPHKHVDLKECGYLNKKNELVCPLHGWAFDLDDGHCTNQSGDYNIYPNKK